MPSRYPFSRLRFDERNILQNESRKKSEIEKNTTPGIMLINKQEMFVPNHTAKAGVTLCL